MVEKKKKRGKNTKNTIAPPPLPVSGCTEIIPRTLIRRGSIITWNKLQSKFTMKVKKKKESACCQCVDIFFFLINLTFYSTSTTKFGYLFIPRVCTCALNSRWNSFPTILSIKTRERDNRRNCSEIVLLYEKNRGRAGAFFFSRVRSVDHLTRGGILILIIF